MPDRPVPEPSSGDGTNDSANTTWHGSDEPPAPWERGTSAGRGWAQESSTAGSPETLRYPPAPPPRPGRQDRRRRTAMVAGMAVLLVVVASAAALLSQRMGTSGSAATAGQDPQTAQSRFQSSPGPVTQATGVAPDWAATAEAVAPSVVSITVSAYQGSARGSGVILDAQGHIVTNHHVVSSASSARDAIMVTLNDKRSFPASIVGTDPSTDLAVLAVQSPPGDLRPITLGDSSSLKVGIPVMAIGNPLGLSGTVTTGIVSALDRPLITSGQSSGVDSGISDNIVTNAIQTSAAINPGNSGGALVNASGQLVGINSSIAQTTQNGGNIGIGFAIPVDAMKNIVAQLLASGRVQHAFLGVDTNTGNVPDGSAQRAAAIVTEVTAGSPAEEAGIRPGDAIVALDGDQIDGSASLVAQVRDRRVGKQVALTVIRDGKRSEVSATLASRPQDG